jgi:hypothetical protein
VDQNSSLITLRSEIKEYEKQLASIKEDLDKLGVGFEGYTNIIMATENSLKILNIDAKVNFTRYVFQGTTVSIDGEVIFMEGADRNLPAYNVSSHRQGRGRDNYNGIAFCFLPFPQGSA